MKLNKVWASALALLALMACNKDIEPSQESLDSVEPKTKTVQVNLTAGQDANAMRVAFGIDDSGKTTGLLMSERNVWLRVVVRRGDAKPVGQDLLFTKTPGRNHATYSGPIQIPTGGSGAYQIAAVLVKEDGGKVYGSIPPEDAQERPGYDPKCIVSFASTGLLTPSASSLEANIPYVCEWQDISVQGDVVQPTALLMKPMGTLLRMRIKNTTTSAKTFDRIAFVTNAFGNAKGFNMLEPKLSGYGVNNSERIELTLSSPLRVEGNQSSSWFYTVLYSRDIPSAMLPQIGTTAIVREADTSTWSVVFSTKQPLPSGSVPVTLNYGVESIRANWDDLVENDPWLSGNSSRPKLAIEYVATHDLDKSKSAFVTTHSTNNGQVGFFTKEQVQQMAQSMPSTLAGYHIPSRAEMISVFLPRTDITSGFYLHADVVKYDNFIDEGVKIGSTTRNYLSDYRKADANSPIYALRFKGTNNCTAYRYRSTDIQESIGVVGKGLAIDCIYIGNNDMVTIEDVAKESFWTSRGSEIVSRTFPFYGESYVLDVETIHGVNHIVHHWTTSTFNETSALWMSISNIQASAFVILKKQDSKGQIRLFSDN